MTIPASVRRSIPASFVAALAGSALLGSCGAPRGVDLAPDAAEDSAPDPAQAPEPVPETELAPPPPDPEHREYTDRIMGTQARLVLHAATTGVADRAAQAAFGRMREMEAVLSERDASSELSRLCDRAGTGPIEVSEDLYRNLELALAFAADSRGVLDPTVAPLVALWRESRETGELPSEDALAEARARTGWRRVTLDRRDRTVALEAGTLLDLGATAKGDACDQALLVLTLHGVESALVELGGDLALGDAPPHRKGWTVARGCPGESEPLELSSVGVATAGDSQQFVLIGGARYAHRIDPRTGLGATDAHCATVVAESGARADALASIASLLGPEQGSALLRRIAPGATVRFGEPGLPGPPD